MNSSNPCPCETFAALSRYDQGSGRGQLMALDELAAKSLHDESLRKQLERGLIDALESGLSDAAVEYACSKLAWIGSESSVPVLTTLLNRPTVTEAALAALRAIPGEAAGKALCRRLERSDLPGQIGVVNATGHRRDAESVPALTRLLESEDKELRAAAANALGEIGTPGAARALCSAAASAQKNGWSASAADSPSDALKAPLSDALLSCAEHLVREKHTKDARTIYSLLVNAPQAHVKHAAQRGLERLA